MLTAGRMTACVEDGFRLLLEFDFGGVAEERRKTGN
jgi:hypothetical protein